MLWPIVFLNSGFGSFSELIYPMGAGFWGCLGVHSGIYSAHRRASIWAIATLSAFWLTLSLDLSDKLPSLAPGAQEPDVPGELFYGEAPPVSSRLCAAGECCQA